MITPTDIDKKQFTVTRVRAGYDQDEVDKFLDALTVDYAEALRKAQAPGSAVAVTQVLPAIPSKPPAVAASAPTGPSVEAIAFLLDKAQAAADKTTADAAAQALVTVQTAQQQAQHILDEANTKAAGVAATAQQQANAVVGAAETQRADLAAKVTALKGTHAGIAAQLQDALSKLAVVDAEAAA